MEQVEHTEHPHKYRVFLFHVLKGQSGTNGTILKLVPFVPCSKNEAGTEITASLLAVPCVPPVPREKHGINKRTRFLSHRKEFLPSAMVFTPDKKNIFESLEKPSDRLSALYVLNSYRPDSGAKMKRCYSKVSKIVCCPIFFIAKTVLITIKKTAPITIM
jgi:hypothetical protein